MKKTVKSNDFIEWSNEKETIHFEKQQEFYPKEREIWYTKMGVNIGFEENGKGEFLRPVLILKKFGNLFFTVALTSKGKDNHYFYYKFNDLDLSEKNRQYIDSSYAILSQVKTIDKKRFTQNIGWVSQKEFSSIKEKLRSVLL